MIQRFLCANHWQLFVLGIVFPGAIYFFVMISMMLKGLTLASETEPNLLSIFNEMANVFRIFPLILLLASGVVCGWMWSIGVGLQQYIDEKDQLSTKWFKRSIIFVFSYMMLFSILMSWSMSEFLSNVPKFVEPNANNFIEQMRSFLYIIAFVYPLHMLAVVSSFYNIYFASKTLKTTEFQCETKFSDFIGEFFIFWFYPIGVWIVQPRINKIVD